MTRTISILMIIVSAVLMQWHSIPFWQEYTENYWSGIAFSIALEAAMLWNWYHRRLPAVRWLAAIILIAGPWYQLTTPTIITINKYRTVQERVEMLRAEVEDNRETVETVESNSKDPNRYGWGKYIPPAKSDLKNSRVRLSNAQADAAITGAIWRPVMVAIMMASVLLIVISTQLAAITSLRSCNVTAVSKSRNPKRASKTEILKKEQLVEQVATVLRSRLRTFDGSQKEFATNHGFRPADISMVLNHAECIRVDGETITFPALKRMAEAL